MFPSGPVSGAFYPAPYNRHSQIDVLKDRLEVTHQLCTALENYLSFDAMAQLDEIENMTDEKVPLASPDDLVHATDYLNGLENQHRQMVEGIDSTPEQLRAAMRGAFAILIGPLETQIEQARKNVSTIQEILEKQTP